MDFKVQHERLLKLVGGFGGKRVLVLGDIMLDEYHWCDVNRISPEAPVPVCSIKESTWVPGGAANVAYNIASLSSTCVLLGVIGKDSTGDKFLSALKERNVDASGIVVSTERSTILKSRVVANQQHVLRLDREDSVDISKADEAALLAQFDAHIDSVDGVIISDYLKGTLTETVLKTVIEVANKLGKFILVDPKGKDYSRYTGASVLTPNFGEFEAVATSPLTSEKTIFSEGLALIERLSLDAIIVTRSEKGMSIISKDGGKLDAPTLAKDVFDITGAGDTVIATLGVGLANGFSVEDAASLANVAAGIVVGKVGTSAVSIDEVKQRLEDI